MLANRGQHGLMSAKQAYQQVWARDAVICGLGLAVADDPEAPAVLTRSLETLGTYQSRLGRIPHNVGEAGVVDPALVAEGGALPATGGDGLVADTAHAGCVDSTLWYILGHYVQARTSGDWAPARAAWQRLCRAYRWLEYQDSNECGLIEVHEAMDWADLFANRYNSLLPNVLWYAANRAMAALSEHACAPGGDIGVDLAARAEDIRYKINQLLWVGPEFPRDEAWIAGHRTEWLYPTRLVDVVLARRPYYLPYMAFRDYGDRFDTFGNLLAILFGVANPEQTDRILDYIVSAGVDQPWPVRACWPVVTRGDKDWRDYYQLRNLNLPHQYHNGGCWPYLGALYAATLVKVGRHEQARQVLARVAEMNRRARLGEEWEFNEWFHGLSGQPMGFPGQSWSAGVFVYAHEALRRGVCPVFDPEHGW